MNTRQLASSLQIVDAKPVPIPYQHVSELVRHKLNISSGEEALTTTNAVQESLGTASILATVHMFAFYTPLDQGGMGLMLGTTAGLAALGTLSFTTLLITIPLSIAAYKNYKQEAAKLVAAINDEENTRQKYREELLYNIMVLRCLFAQNEAEFNHVLNTLNLDKEEVNALKLQQQANAFYQNPVFREAKLQADEKRPAAASQQLLPHLLADAILSQDDDIHEEIMSELRKIDKEYQKNTDECFKEIAPLPIVNRSEAVMEGVSKALSISSALIGTATTFAGICITAGFCVALSATGWGVLIAAIIIGCIIFGACTGIAKQKNLQREELQLQIKKRNEKLVAANHHVKAAITRKQLLVAEQKAAQYLLEQKNAEQKTANVINGLSEQVTQGQLQLAAEKQSHAMEVAELQRQLAEEKQARINAEKALRASRENIEQAPAQPIPSNASAANIRFFNPPENPAGYSTTATPDMKRVTAHAGSAGVK